MLLAQVLCARYVVIETIAANSATPECSFFLFTHKNNGFPEL